MPVSPIPAGFTAVTPYLLVPDVTAQVAFMQAALGARLNLAMPPQPPHFHADMQIDTAHVMIGNGGPHFPPMPCMLYIYTENVDALHARAVAAGGVSTQEPRDEFYGDRTAAIKDPHGNLWYLATHKEDLTPEQIGARMAAPKTSH